MEVKAERNPPQPRLYHKVLRCSPGRDDIIMVLECGCTKSRSYADLKISPGKKLPIPSRATCKNHGVGSEGTFTKITKELANNLPWDYSNYDGKNCAECTANGFDHWSHRSSN